MTITSIKPRRDGKYLVGLHFNHGVNLRKIMTVDELSQTKANIAADQEIETEQNQNETQPASLELAAA